MSVKLDDGRWHIKAAHRVAFEVFRGGLDPKLDIDHLCRVRSCVNPDHMEQVVTAVNVQRGLLNHHGVGAVLRVRTLHACAMRERDIVEITGIPQQTVNSITSRRTWRNL